MPAVVLAPWREEERKRESTTNFPLSSDGDAMGSRKSPDPTLDRVPRMAVQEGNSLVSAALWSIFHSARGPQHLNRGRASKRPECNVPGSSV